MEEIQRPQLLVLVRHGESIRNKEKGNNVYLPSKDVADLVSGYADREVPLTPYGEQQALLTGTALRKRFGQFDVVYDSGYERTRKTREKAMSAYSKFERDQMKFRESYLVREREPGYTHSMTTEEADQNFPYLREHFKREGYFYARPPGGESQADNSQRVYSFIGTLFRLRKQQKVLVFTHGGTIRAFRFNLERWTPDQYLEHMEETPENCGVTVYELDPVSKNLKLVEFNTVYWKP